MASKFGFQITVKDKTIWVFPEDVEAALAAAQATAKANAKAVINAGITYGWTRGPGEDPIKLGTFDDLLNFIDTDIIAKLPNFVKADFDVSDQFDALIAGLPEPLNEGVDDLTKEVSFELDGIRLKIPAKASKEKTQFELAMMVDLLKLELELGPFKLNRLYAKFGNFDLPKLPGAQGTTSAN